MLSRAAAWERLMAPNDVLVIGGGVTGAAILLEAAHRGLRATLIERGDFASGTSSRSSKLVHGGLRYIKEGKLGLTRESVHERETLLREAHGLVDPMEFLLPHYRGGKPGRAITEFGLVLYDLLAGRKQHRYVSREEALQIAPLIDSTNLIGAHLYGDATTDDARLVLRLIQDAEDAGAAALNYVEAIQLVRRNDQVVGAAIRDGVTGAEWTASAQVVINATGVFADSLRGTLGEEPKIRPLRGSHLLIAHQRLPLSQAVAFMHPRDGRPVFAYPWLGMTLAGTTDLDHAENLRNEPSIAPEEVEYLLEALQYQFPHAGIARDHVISTYAGVRPIVTSGKTKPSQEGRDHLLLDEHGLITITGGKLTTFRPMALAALRAAAERLDRRIDLRAKPIFAHPGKYGAHETHVAQIGELRWAVGFEKVEHLDDLLLRRTRLGLQHADGAAHLLADLRDLCMKELHWNNQRWEDETRAYLQHRKTYYGVPA